MDTVNRMLWSVIATLLLAAGVLGLLAGLQMSPNTVLVSPELRHDWQRLGTWPLAVGGVLGLLVAWLGWRLLRAELRRGGRRSLPDVELPSTADHTPTPSHAGHTAVRPSLDELPPLAPDTRAAGRTSVRSPALAHGAERDFERIPDVRRALVGLFGDTAHPELRARLDVAPGTSVTHLSRAVADGLDRFAATSGLLPAPVRITVRLDGPPNRVA